MLTLQLNVTKTETIALDANSAAWLTVIETQSDKQLSCAVPEPIFEVLKNWSLVEGTHLAATLSARGRARLVAERAAVAKEKKSKGKKRKS